jgi:hypothetical protein
LGDKDLPRRQKIPQSIDSQYFTDVTPLWVAPGREPIPDKYHDAVQLLAEWAGPSWSDNEQTDFFLIRTVVVQSCDSWAAYDWGADEQRISELRSDSRRHATLVKAAENIANLLGQPGFRSIKRRFLRSFLLDIGGDIRVGLTNGEAVAAVERSFQRLAEGAKIQSWPRVRYGAIEYESLPGRLPQREVAVALSLADRITFFRKDGHSAGSLGTPHPPNISPKLPWRAIAYFASANASADRQLDESSIQKQVTSLARSVESVHWSAR